MKAGAFCVVRLTAQVYLYDSRDAFRFCAKQISDHIVHGFDLICHIGLCSAEQQAIFHVSFYSGDQLICDTVGNLAR